MARKWGVTSCLLSGMTLQVGRGGRPFFPPCTKRLHRTWTSKKTRHRYRFGRAHGDLSLQLEGSNLPYTTGAKKDYLQVFRAHIWGSFENHLLSWLRHGFRGFQWKFLSFWCETGKADSCGKCEKWWGKIDNNGPFPLFRLYITWSHLISYPKRFKDLCNMYWVYPPQYHSTSVFTLTGWCTQSCIIYTRNIYENMYIHILYSIYIWKKCRYIFYSTCVFLYPIIDSSYPPLPYIPSWWFQPIWKILVK